MDLVHNIDEHPGLQASDAVQAEVIVTADDEIPPVSSSPPTDNLAANGVGHVGDAIANPDCDAPLDAKSLAADSTALASIPLSVFQVGSTVTVSTNRQVANESTSGEGKSMKSRSQVKANVDSRNGKAKEAKVGGPIHLELVEESGMQLFIDQHGLEWARVLVRNHHETLRLQSKAFRNWLIRYYLGRGQTISQRAVRECVGQLSALADSEQRELANRSAWSEDKKALWIDLVDRQCRAVRVTASGWAIESNPPSLFRRFVHQQALPEPDPSGAIQELLSYLPPLGSDGDRLLLLAWVVTALVPMPRPILTLVGQHGSAKSTVSTFLRRLLDPSRVELLGKDARGDLPLVFFKHAVSVFDNNDGLTPNEADLCCQAVTGRGIARRMLYTDAEEFILSFQRAIIVNGLRLPTNRPDFLDRALIIDLERLQPEQRSLLEQIDAKFMEGRPRLFGGLLNALSRTLAKLPEVSTEGLSRMADFHRMGRAVAEVLGFTAQQFDEAYKVAEARQKRGAFDNTLALAILLFARQVHRWKGDPTQLFQRLHETAKANQIRQSPEFWPDTPIGLGRQLKHLSETLARHGVQVTRPRRAEARLIVLEYDPAADNVGDDD